jgi:hypothetical protein
MKSLIAILIYLGTFMSMFFVLSLIGTLWFNYTDVISNNGWFMVYSMFFGWWMSIFPTREYYVKNQDYFSEVF